MGSDFLSQDFIFNNISSHLQLIQFNYVLFFFVFFLLLHCCLCVSGSFSTFLNHNVSWFNSTVPNHFQHEDQCIGMIQFFYTLRSHSLLFYCHLPTATQSIKSWKFWRSFGFMSPKVTHEKPFSATSSSCKSIN